MNIKIDIKNNVNISAIYYALLQNGYDYYVMERNAEEINIIKSFINNNSTSTFFLSARQSNCEAYNYWPRAALMESASFCISPETPKWNSFEQFQHYVFTANNIDDKERNESFWKWINQFPVEIQTVIHNQNFKEYFKWESTWIEKQKNIHLTEFNQLKHHIDFCIKNYGAKFKTIDIILSPIKCYYSCDFHISKDTFMFTSGQFDAVSVLHEYLHHIIHPIVNKLKDEISKFNTIPNLDASYYLTDDKLGSINAFEEFAVRTIVDSFSNNTMPNDLEKYIKNLI